MIDRTTLLRNRSPARRAGILHDVEATDKSIAAGGKNSVKGEFGVSDPYATPGARKASASELIQKINKIESISLKARRPARRFRPVAPPSLLPSHSSPRSPAPLPIR